MPLAKGIFGVLSHPGTQLGFAIHFTSGFSTNAFLYMWGLPYLQQAQGLDQAVASGMFTLLSVSGIIIGPVLGILTAQHPLRRSNLALGIIFAGFAVWVVVLLWPGPSPMWLIVVLVLTLAAGTPATAVGLDFARTQLPPHRLGLGNGVIIMGAFIGGTAAVLLIGLALGLQSDGSSGYTFAEFQRAMAVQIPIYMLGIAAIYFTRWRLRRSMREQGIIVPTWSYALMRTYRKWRHGLRG